MDERTFASPPAGHRALPFWFWNGDMKEEEIDRQIREMAEKGVGGFFLCARQGMSVPYLSQDWFDLVRAAVRSAERCGLEVWLYDEYPYPSGVAGGEVLLEHPDAKQRTLTRRAERVDGGSVCELELPWGRALWAKAVPVGEDGGKLWDRAVDVSGRIGSVQEEQVFQQTGSTPYHRKRYFTYDTAKKLIWRAPDDAPQWEVAVIMEHETEDFKYFGTFVDPLHEEAMNTFIRLTHERYAREIGGFFGTTVKGMFTDEIGLRVGKIPWSPVLPAYIRSKHGYDLLDKLHLLYEDGGEETARVRYDFFQAIHLLLRDTYHKKVHDWCERYGLEYVAEVPGVRMTTQLYSHIPGGDTAHEKLGRPLDWMMKRYAHSLRANPKTGSSLARQLGRPRALIECFHSVGWSMTLQDAKWMIDWMAALGTNMFNFHAFFYSIDGMRKYDAPPSQFYQNPYWKHFRLLGDYIGRLSGLMRQGAAKIDIALIDPSTSFWTHMGNPFHAFKYGGENEEEKRRLETLKAEWTHLQTALLSVRRDYDTLDPELLPQAEVDGGTLRIGSAVYKALVLPPLANLEAAAWERIKAFIRSGGIVVSAGLLPYESIETDGRTAEEMPGWFGADGAAPERFWSGGQSSSHGEAEWLGGPEGSAYFVPYRGASPDGGDDNARRVVRLLDEVLPREVELTADDGAEGDVLMQIRQLDDRREALFLCSRSGERRRMTLRLRAPAYAAGVRARLRDLETGETRPIACAGTPQGPAIELVFEPYQSHVIELDLGADSAGNGSAAGAPPPSLLEWNADAPWQVEAEQPNALRLGAFRMAFDLEDAGLAQGWHLGGEAAAAVPWFEAEAKPWINVGRERGEPLSLPLRFASKSGMFGTPLRPDIAYPVVCWYKADFLVEDVPDRAELRMDDEAVLGERTLYVNGTPWTGGPLPLRVGANTIAARVVIRRPYDGIVDPLYISGRFGVAFRPDGTPVITASPETANPNRPVVERFPYYAGTLVFRRTVRIEASETGREVEIHFPDLHPDFHDCAELWVNGHSLGVRAWAPYRWTADAAWLLPGDNEVELKIAGTLSQKLDGQYFDYSEHRMADVREAGA